MRRVWIYLMTALVLFCMALTGCAGDSVAENSSESPAKEQADTGSFGTPEKTALKAVVVSKFEVGEMTGDMPGEAQLLYEQYCAGCEENTETLDIFEPAMFNLFDVSRIVIDAILEGRM